MKKTLSILLVLVVAFAFLTGCKKASAPAATPAPAPAAPTAPAAAPSAPATPAASTTAAPAASTPAAPAASTPAASTASAYAVPAVTEPVSIKLWYSISGANGDFFKSQVEKFAAEHPNFTIETTYTGSYSDTATKVSAAKLAGNGPDLVITSASQLYPGEDGDFRMAEFVKDPEFDFNDVQPGMFEYATYDGQIAAVPFAVSSQVVYYNKDLAKQAGYDLEKNPPKTWQEFANVAKDIAAKTGTVGFDTSDQVWLFKSMLSQNGNNTVEIIDGKIVPVFDNESAIEVGKFWEYLCNEGIMPANSHGSAENTFKAGGMVFLAATSARINTFSTSLQFNVGAIEMPYFKHPAVALGGSTMTILTADKTKANAAWQIIKYVINTENQGAFSMASGYLPTRKSVLESPAVRDKMATNELYRVASKQTEYAWSYTHFGAMGSMDAEIWYATDDIESGRNVVEALQEHCANTAAEIDY